MARDPLRILLSIRRNAVEEARSALGACLKAEADAAEGIRFLEEAAQRDREVSASWSDAYHFVEMSVIRAEVIRANRLDAVQALAVAEMHSAAARQAVAAARMASEAVEQLIQEREAANAAEAATKEQHVLDDIARMRRAG